MGACMVQVQMGFQPMLTKECIDKEKVILVSIVVGQEMMKAVLAMCMLQVEFSGRAHVLLQVHQDVCVSMYLCVCIYTHLCLWTSNKAITMKIRQKLHARGLRLACVFKSIDSNGDGFLTSNELKVGLKRMQFNLTDAELSSLVDYVDSGGESGGGMLG